MTQTLSQSELFRLITGNAEDMIAVGEMAGKRVYNGPVNDVRNRLGLPGRLPNQNGEIVRKASALLCGIADLRGERVHRMRFRQAH